MRLKYRTAFAVVFLSLTFSGLWHTAATAAPASEAKNLRGRLGVGFTNQIANSADSTIPALSAKYYLSRSLAFAIGTGFDTRANDSTFALGGKIFKNVFYESNLIFYLGAGLAYVSRQGSKLQGSAFIGAEYFFAQLPSLGFSMEAGLRGDNQSGSFSIRTTGASFLTAGMHFYF